MLLLCYPKCTTCQKAQKWLDDHHIVYTSRDIKLERPTEAELTEWYGRSGKPLRAFLNTSGLSYRALGGKAALDGVTEDALIALLAGDGMLVKRPLLVGETFVLVGFREAEWEKALPQK